MRPKQFITAATLSALAAGFSALFVAGPGLAQTVAVARAAHRVTISSPVRSSVTTLPDVALAHLAHRPAPAVLPVRRHVVRRAAPAIAPPASTTPAPVTSAPPSGGTDWAATSFGQCVRQAENGGSYAWGTGNGGGAYQFLLGTWEAHGGAAGYYGNAGPAYQDQIFNNTVNADGGGDWSPYDGCPFPGTATTSAVYANPLRGVSGLGYQRVDAGVDYGGSGPVYAIGSGTVLNVTNGGWPDGIFIVYQLNAGPDSGRDVYVAEGLTPAVWVGEGVTNQTVLGTMWPGSSIETGWACYLLGDAQARCDGQWAFPTPDGESFLSFMSGLGASTAAKVSGADPPVTVTLTAFVTKTAGQTVHRLPLRVRAMNWAIKHKGCPYDWGGTGCDPGFDCSGLVYMAYRHAGVTLPRTTYGMLASPLLVRVYHPRRGDLAFYGPGHVELYSIAGRHETFGALDSGNPVWWHHWDAYWHPTAFYRVK